MMLAMGWCRACEQYENAPGGCQEYWVPPMSGESMRTVVYFERFGRYIAVWERARRVTMSEQSRKR